ncbi:hypothetical protein TRFO_23740 [Tritrichomonas foetus]|uniref:Thioredoxin domain-containing protein n=1 Tax=Tritrichomonas foetus TaxID=1144522 RepID=A0A1J4K8Z4_9EUKA|nr:hypothetical protein TRFO_23740 [Tritrichomonas foetus]|eukprot:OHT07879.1 hypothetical protein TRFO_23740 [Tritrichomonas foetus]
MITFILLCKFACSIPISRENSSAVFNQDTSKFIFVALISDYCPHCKKVPPILSLLEEHYNNKDYILIGEIKCDYEKMLCNKFPDVVTPSFYFVKGSLESAEQYHGAIEYSEMISFIEKKISPSFINLSNEQEFEKECEKINESSIFLLQNFNNQQLNEIHKMSIEFHSYPCHFLNILYKNPKIWNKNLTQKENQHKLNQQKENQQKENQQKDNQQKDNPQKDNQQKENSENPVLCNFYYPNKRIVCFDKSFTPKKMRKFVKKHVYPVVGPVSQQFMNHSKKLKTSVLLLSDEFPYFESAFRQMSKNLPDDLISGVISCANNKVLCLNLMVQTGQGPKILIYNPYKRYIWYYRKDFNETSILEWTNNVLKGKVRPTGPGTGFFGYLGNLFDISRDNGMISFSIYVAALATLILVFVVGTANTVYRRNKLYQKLD